MTATHFGSCLHKTVWKGLRVARQLWTFLIPAPCRAACCLKAEATYMKYHQHWSNELFFFYRMAKKYKYISLKKKTPQQRWLSVFLEENSVNVPWSGWDEEITKQTGGFTRDQNLLRGAKQKQKLQQRPDEKEKTWASFKSQKTHTIKKRNGERQRIKTHPPLFFFFFFFY